MNERIKELAEQAEQWAKKATWSVDPTIGDRPYEELFQEKFAELIVKECAKELRDAEREADRAFNSGEVKERNTFDGYDFADMMEERFGVKE